MQVLTSFTEVVPTFPLVWVTEYTQNKNLPAAEQTSEPHIIRSKYLTPNSNIAFLDKCSSTLLLSKYDVKSYGKVR